MQPQDILHFWFEETESQFWFQKSDEFDQKIREKFTETHQLVAAGKTTNWREIAEGRLAEIIVLDQFSRNMFRDTPKAFAYDALALKLAKDAIEMGADQKLSIQQRGFLYMPFMHSESIEDHEVATKLFDQQGLEYSLKFEILHKNIIDRFGRYPHRNKILNRNSTPEEIEFLKQPGSGF